MKPLSGVCRNPKGFGVGVLLAAAVAGGAYAQAPAPAVGREKPAYVEMLRGDQAREKGDAAQALRQYEAALQLFSQIATEDPAYLREAISYRIRYCREQIAAMTRLLQEAPALPPAVTPAPPVPAPAPAPAPAPINEEAVRQVQELEQTLKDLSARLDEANRKLEEDPGGLKKKLRELERQRGELEDRARTAEKGAAKLTKEMEKRQAEIDKLKADITGARATLAENEEAAAVALEALRKEREALEKELKQAKRAPPPPVEPPAPPSPDPALVAEVERLRAELARKDEELKLAKAAPVPETPAPQPPADVTPPAPPAVAPPAVAVPTAPVDLDTTITPEALAARETEVRALLEQQPRDPGARFELARILMIKGALPESRRLAVRLADDFNGNAIYQHLAGFVNLRMGRSGDAAEYLDRAVALAPDNARFLSDLAMAESLTRQYARAIETYRRVIALQPQNGRAHFNLAVLLARGDEAARAEAQKMYDRARELGEPADPAIEARLKAPPAP